MGRILDQVFEIRGDGLSRIYHRKKDDDDASWVESVKDLDSSSVEFPVIDKLDRPKQ